MTAIIIMIVWAKLLTKLICGLELDYNTSSYSSSLTFDSVVSNRCKDRSCYDPTKKDVVVSIKNAWLRVTVGGVKEVGTFEEFSCPTTNCNLTVQHSTSVHSKQDAYVLESKPNSPKHDPSQVWIFLDLESSVGFVRNGVGMVEDIPHIDFVLSHTRLSKKNLWQPLSYIDADFNLFRIKGASFEERKRPIYTFISNHRTKSERDNLLTELQQSYEHNRGETEEWKNAFPVCSTTQNINSHYNAIKECTYFYILFSFSVENSYEAGYMTEKVWQALKMGAIPIMERRDLFQSYLPTKHAAIFVEDFASVTALGEYLSDVARDERLWKVHTNWKTMPSYFWNGRFKRLVEESSYNAGCLLCERVRQFQSSTGTFHFERLMNEKSVCMNDIFLREYIHPLSREDGHILTPIPFTATRPLRPTPVLEQGKQQQKKQQQQMEVLYILMPPQYIKSSMEKRLTSFQAELHEIIAQHKPFLLEDAEIFLIDVYNLYSIELDQEIGKCFFGVNKLKKDETERIALLNHLYVYYHILIQHYTHATVIEYDNNKAAPTAAAEGVLALPETSTLSSEFQFVFPSFTKTEPQPQPVIITAKGTTTTPNILLHRAQLSHYLVSYTGAESLFSSLVFPLSPTSIDQLVQKYVSTLPVVAKEAEEAVTDQTTTDKDKDTKDTKDVVVIAHNPDSFLQLHAQYTETCSNRDHNIVLPRRDSYNVDLESKRAWSMNYDTIFDFLNIDPATNTNTKTKTTKKQKRERPMCDSAQATIDSVAYPVAQEPCQLSWYSSEQVCAILHQYSLVWWSGDSLTRQQTQALFMLLTSDLQYGGIPLKAQSTLTSYGICGCDGQFSESIGCREQMNFPRPPADVGTGTHFLLPDWSEWGLCPGYVEPTSFAMDSVNWLSLNITCPVSRKPIFIQLQFGHHCGINTDTCIPVAIQRMEDIQSRLKDCLDRVKIVFVGATVCSDAVVRKYPHQSREHVFEYNTKMKAWFQEHYPQVLTMQYYNVTKDTLDRTSDGFHPLSDVNLIKAITTLNIMHQQV